jgi:hypothetical protein
MNPSVQRTSRNLLLQNYGGRSLERGCRSRDVDIEEGEDAGTPVGAATPPPSAPAKSESLGVSDLFMLRMGHARKIQDQLSLARGLLCESRNLVDQQSRALSGSASGGSAVSGTSAGGCAGGSQHHNVDPPCAPNSDTKPQEQEQQTAIGMVTNKLLVSCVNLMNDLWDLISNQTAGQVSTLRSNLLVPLFKEYGIHDEWIMYAILMFLLVVCVLIVMMFMRGYYRVSSEPSSIESLISPANLLWAEDCNDIICA